MSKIQYKPDMVCPYCGNDEFFVRQSFTGTCGYNMKFNLKAADNSEMYDNVTFKTIGKYAYCNNCFKRLFSVDELPYFHE